jgi:transposase-like protein
VDAVLPVLYLRGISSGDLQEALAALVGPNAPALSPQVLSRLKAAWKDEHDRWQNRDLSARHYVYLWADGIYLQGRMEDARSCVLVIIGATPEGKKELVGFQTGYRESAQSWRELLAGLKARGLSISPELAVGDGALGFWKALDEVFPTCRHQRCWVHKTANVLNKLPKTTQKTAKGDLQAIWMAQSRAEAGKAMNGFAAKYDAKYPKAVACLAKDRDALLSFYDFPAEHWQHLRTTNPIESVFATVRHRTVRTKGCLSHNTSMTMVFKLVIAAAKTWRRLRGYNQLPKVIQGVRFTDGIEVISETKNAAA